MSACGDLPRLEAKRSAELQRPGRVRVDRLALDVSPRSLHNLRRRVPVAAEAGHARDLPRGCDGGTIDRASPPEQDRDRLR